MPDQPTPSTAADWKSFLGIGWSFPPEFLNSETGAGVLMTSDREDIERSIQILFGTAAGERFLVPDYGADLRELLFDPVSTSMATFVKDRIRTALLIYEPRIKVLDLVIDPSRSMEGIISIEVQYEIRSTNSRYNLVYPFYLHDGSEVRPRQRPMSAGVLRPTLA